MEKPDKEAMLIRKADGEEVIFDPHRLATSLERAGATPSLRQAIVAEVVSGLYPHISTKEIYERAFRMLRLHSRPTAARYKLKRAIMELGPTGFPFEKFIAEVLNRRGFITETGVIVEGHCVSHEVDVVANRDSVHLYIECKYHSSLSRNSDVKTALYVQARFLDIKKAMESTHPASNRKYVGGIYTNTRFTSEALRYGECAGLRMVGWDYPLGSSLKDQVEQSGLYPVTCLTTLNKKEKQLLLSKNVVLCRRIYNQPELLQALGMSNKKLREVREEIEGLCGEIRPDHTAGTGADH